MAEAGPVAADIATSGAEDDVTNDQAEAEKAADGEPEGTDRKADIDTIAAGIAAETEKTAPAADDTMPVDGEMYTAEPEALQQIEPKPADMPEALSHVVQLTNIARN